MDESLLTIVIPTRDRPDTLKEVINHLLLFPLPRVEVLICDNYSKIPVSDILGVLPNEFRIVRSEKRLSMPENWRLGLSEVTTPYVTVIGDDDLIWKNRYLWILPHLESREFPVVFWFRHAYWWKRFRDQHLSNVLLFTNDKVAAVINLDDLLDVVYPRTFDYQWLPSVYNSVVDTNLAKSSFGRLENLVPADCLSPDVSSAFRISSKFKRGLFISAPISISGISHNSNGMNPNLQKQFWAEFDQIKMRPQWFQEKLRFLGQGVDPGLLLSHIHDYYAGLDLDCKLESDVGTLLEIHKNWVARLVMYDQVAVAKSLLVDCDFFSTSQSIADLEKSCTTIHPIHTGAYPQFSQNWIRLSIPEDLGDLCGVASYLNNLSS
jgi:glycosyltransferase involved in cell wall biosynthesis